MPELTTVSTSLLSKAMFRLLKHISKKWLRKHYPLDFENNVKVEVASGPVWYTGSVIDTLHLTLKFSNYSPHYDYTILGVGLELTIDNQRIFETAVFRHVPLPKGARNVSIGIQADLTCKRAHLFENKFNDPTSIPCQVDAKITVQSILGVHVHSIKVCDRESGRLEKQIPT